MYLSYFINFLDDEPESEEVDTTDDEGRVITTRNRLSPSKKQKEQSSRNGKVKSSRSKNRKRSRHDNNQSPIRNSSKKKAKLS